MTERWSGLLKVPLCHNSGACYKVAASLCLTPLKSLQVPSANAIFFSGDRVKGTGNPVIEKLSNAQHISEILVSKFGSSINVWVIKASTFNGPFAVYKDFIPSANEWGEPSSYNPTGFPTSSSIVRLLSNCLIKVKNLTEEHQKDSIQTSKCATKATLPKTIILGFSKGGTVLNQVVTELSFSDIMPTATNPSNISENQIIPASKEILLDSITEIHYVDVGLNSPGAYLTDQDTIKRLSTRAVHGGSCIRFMIHGTPRQWNNRNRVWILNEKNKMVELLETECQASHGKVVVNERFYFGDRSPDMQMHFEIIEAMDVSLRLELQ
ncbi:unnamed protein product [Rhodiola kirilowii]